MKDKIAIQIASKDRATEVGLLLESLRHQTYQSFDIFVLDDGSNVPLTNFYFIQYIAHRMKIEGHNITFIRNNEPSGVSNARQQLVDKVMEEDYKYKYLARIDDDSVCDEYFLEELLKGIEAGYDLVGSVVPNLVGPDFKRDIKNVEPIIGYVELDDKGEINYFGDDCGLQYYENKILPTVHFRSTCLYKRELHEQGVDYNNRLSKHGFLEEAIFSFKAILKGFKLGINTNAINWHLNTPSGGERNTTNMTGFNKKIFDETVKRMFEDNGNFIEDYYKKLKIDLSKLNVDYKSQFNLFRK